MAITELTGDVVTYFVDQKLAEQVNKKLDAAIAAGSLSTMDFIDERGFYTVSMDVRTNEIISTAFLNVAPGGRIRTANLTVGLGGESYLKEADRLFLPKRSRESRLRRNRKGLLG